MAPLRRLAALRPQHRHLPLILVDAAGLLCGLITLSITLSMRGSLLDPRTWGECPRAPPNMIDSRSAEPAPAAG